MHRRDRTGAVRPRLRLSGHGNRLACADRERTNPVRLGLLLAGLAAAVSWTVAPAAPVPAAGLPEAPTAPAPAASGLGPAAVLVPAARRTATAAAPVPAVAWPAVAAPPAGRGGAPEVASPAARAGAAQASGAAAQPRPEGEPRSDEVTGVLVRIGTPVRVRAGETERTVVVVGADATIDGAVRENLVVIDGNARVAGTVGGNAVVMGGRLELEPGARVAGDVVLAGNSTLARAPGATVEGTVRRRAGISLGPVAGWLAWLGLTLALVAAGALFAAAGGRQLGEAATLLLRRPGPVVVATLVMIAAVPILALLSFITLIGIPLGIALLVVLIPALGFAGYIVAACALGDALLRRAGRGRERLPPLPGEGGAAAERSGSTQHAASAERGAPTGAEPGVAGAGTPALPHGPGGIEHEPAGSLAGGGARGVHPYREVLLGVVVFQLLMLIPVLGGLVLLLIAHLGAGALVYRSWLAYRRPRPEAEPGLEARRAA